MNVNELIIAALSSLHIPVEPDVYEENEEEYVVFNYTDDAFENHCDDAPESEYITLQVHYYVRGKSPLNTRKRIIKLLYRYGFDVTPGPILYETKTKYRHAVISVGLNCVADLKGE